jgi:hypothetical protein
VSNALERVAFIAAKYIRCYLNRSNPIGGVDEAREDFDEVNAYCKTGVTLTTPASTQDHSSYVGGGDVGGGGDASLSRSPLSSPTPSTESLLAGLLRECRSALEDGLETPGVHEGEWSIQDRDLIARIDAALPLGGSPGEPASVDRTT